MESNRYFVMSEVDKIWTVNVYDDCAQAVHDFIRTGGLITPDIIFAEEAEVSLRVNNRTMEYQKKGGTDEDKPEDTAVKS